MTTFMLIRGGEGLISIALQNSGGKRVKIASKTRGGRKYKPMEWWDAHRRIEIELRRRKSRFKMRKVFDYDREC
jgi:hypothetical protein